MQDHDLVRGQFYYTLPTGLLNHLEQHVGASRFDATLWGIERELSRLAGANATTVGFFRGAPIDCAYLREHPLDADVIQCIRETTQGDPDAVVRVAQERLSLANRNVRAFLGWLLSNRTFLEEHSRVWGLVAPLVSQGGMPRPVQGGSSAGLAALGFSPGTDESEREALGELRQFCARWRLVQLQGPLLPMPLPVQFPAMNPVFAAQLANASGYGMISVPDTMPLPSEDDLRDMMATSIPRNDAAHLAPWQAIVSAGNAARSTLPRHARLFELQHYVRLLMSRHAAAFHRRAYQLHSTLAAFLGVSEDAIRRDLRFVEQRLGREWWGRFPIPIL